jgi:uncharacterized cupin superfamily protein
MSDVTIKKITEVEPYQGPNTIPGIRFRPAGRALGVTAWGMNVLQLEAGCTGYPEHDHSKDGQEEVYVILEGSATLVTGGTKTPVDAGTIVRVGPGTTRKFIPGGKGVTILGLGGTPGHAYQPRR